jgi:hypothetical protein
MNGTIRCDMDFITSMLSNPIVILVGYVLSLVASIIAVHQFISANKAKKELVRLNVALDTLRVENLKIKNEIQSKVKQGDRSQFFQQNSGSVNIDNRG